METIVEFFSFLLIELPARVIGAAPGSPLLVIIIVVVILALLLLLRSRAGRKKRQR